MMKKTLFEMKRGALGVLLAAGFAFPAIAGNFSGTGAQPVARGGTGRATVPQNNLIFGNGTSPIGFLSPAGFAGRCVVSDGTIWAAQFCLVTGSIVGTAPVTVNIASGVATVALAIDTNFAVISNQLGLASIASGSLIANASAIGAEPTQTTLTAYLDRAIGATNGQFAARIGGTWGPATFGAGLAFSGSVLSCIPGTSSLLGCLRPDGTTITASSGVLTVVGSPATSVTIGTTTIGGTFTNNHLLSVGAGALADAGGPRFLAKQIFTSTGANTFTAPAGTLPATIFEFTLRAAGGSGGGGDASHGGGAGGGAGEEVVTYQTGYTAGNTVICTVGTGGGAPGGANTGVTGGNTTLASGTQTITTITSHGGAGGGTGTSNTPQGGAGGTGGNGDLNIPGQDGGSGWYLGSAASGNGMGGIGGGPAGSAGGTPTVPAGRAPGFGGGSGGGGSVAGSTNGGSAAGGNGFCRVKWVL